MTTIPIRDVSLFVEIMGQGYPLVLMHGGPGMDYSTLLPLKPLADQFTLVFYDHRCNGRSEGAEQDSMTWENLTADADALRQKLGFEKWAVLGHSFGGNVAMEYALRYPQSLSHLILLDTGGDQGWVLQNIPEILKKRGYSPAAVEAARRFYTGQVTPGEFLSTAMKFMKAYYYHFSLLKLAHDALFKPQVKYRPEASIFGCTQLLTGWTVMDRLGEIRVPTLVMAGRFDFLFPVEHEAALAAGIPGARLEMIECAGHNPQDENPAATIAGIRSFLADVSPGYAEPTPAAELPGARV